MKATFCHGQRGAALVVALIMLTLVTLLATVASNSVQTNLKIVQNIESRAMVENAALSAIEALIATNDIDEFNGATLYFDASGDGIAGTEIAVQTSRGCVTVRPILNDELNVLNPAEAACYRGGSVDGTSRCADVLWDVEFDASDTVTGARTTIRQGLEVQSDVNLVASC